MSFWDTLLGTNKGDNTDMQYDMTSWRNLEYSDMCVVIAKSLTAYRDEHNLTQWELAQILGCNKNVVIKLETCKLDDISFRLLIDLWTRLSTPEYSFGDLVMKELHKVVLKNYKQLCKRRWG